MLVVMPNAMGINRLNDMLLMTIFMMMSWMDRDLQMMILTSSWSWCWGLLPPPKIVEEPVLPYYQPTNREIVKLMPSFNYMEEEFPIRNHATSKQQSRTKMMYQISTTRKPWEKGIRLTLAQSWLKINFYIKEKRQVKRYSEDSKNPQPIK